jgi:hypothetical protein
MPSDDRERQFHQALERHMREPSQQVACPDAETLAAYHERTLSLEELAKWKEHIAGCVRCQETLALVEETGSLAADEWKEQTVATGQATLLNVAKTPSVVRSIGEGTSAEMAHLAAASPMATAPGKVVGRSSWKWIAPVGALAAGLLLFVAVRERKLATPVSSIEVAQNREAAAPPAKQPEMPESRKPEQSSVTRNDDPALRQKAAKPQTKAPPPIVSNQSASRVYGYTTAANEADKLSKDDRGVSGALESKPMPRANAEVQEQRPRDLDAARTESGLPPPAPVPAVNAKGAVAAGGAAELKKENTDSANKAKALGAATTAEIAAAPATASKQAVQFSGVGSSLRKTALVDSRMIVAPDGKHAWRVGATGVIEATADGGRSWNLQESGVSNDLTSGSAPSEKVCWLVGKGGTILITTDGGKQWVARSSPIPEDLSGVHALDANHATVWSLSNRKSFETADGGVSWTPAANE